MNNLTIFGEQTFIKRYKIENRRYIGNKAKLVKWIISIISKETQKRGTFIDLFAGSASVANGAKIIFNKLILNDILHSNYVIYNAFFKPDEWDKNKLLDIIRTYNFIKSEELEENYFSENFGDKFFEKNAAKKIGYIREDLEVKRKELNDKEYYILLASLIYSMDKVANTVGHFDAYIKKPIKRSDFELGIVCPEKVNEVEIYREDANKLAEKIKGDVVYIDPPYNSRQYSRFYHVYETLVKWNKPKLYGVALKPEPENMSKYSTTKAKETLTDLVKKIDADYLIISYNNTYNSKSKSSQNKITYEEMSEILNQLGKTKIFEKDYRFFNAGKTEFNNHKEFLFVTKL